MDVEPFGAVRFTSLARLLAQEARRHGLAAPGYRFPPRLPEVDRTIRRYPGGGAVIAVRVRGRSPEAVANDMVEGLIVANDLTGKAAAGWRVVFRGVAGLEDVAVAAEHAERAHPAEVPRAAAA